MDLAKCLAQLDADQVTAGKKLPYLYPTCFVNDRCT